MHPIQLGSTLLQKYRIDRFRRRKDGVLLYEGVDASRLRRVCVKVLERAASTDTVRCARFHDEAHTANVIDIGSCEGLPYFVTTVCELAPPPPRPSKKPPPLPSKAPSSSKQPPLPKPKPPSLEIPIVIDDDDVVPTALLPLPLPPLPPPPPISSETLLPTAFETPAPARTRASWILFVAMTTITGFAGWFVGRAQSDVVAPAAAHERVMDPPTMPTTTTPPPPAASVSEPDAVPPPVASAPPESSAKHRRPASDPLTL